MAVTEDDKDKSGEANGPTTDPWKPFSATRKFRGYRRKEHPTGTGPASGESADTSSAEGEEDAERER